jgi:hypothetical protein
LAGLDCNGGAIDFHRRNFGVKNNTKSDPKYMKTLVLPLAAVGLICLSGCSKSDAPAAKTPTSPEKPPVVATPPAKAASWLSNLDGVETPKTPVAGQIHGQDFKAVYASVKGTGLILTTEAPGHPLEHGLQIMFYDGTELATMANKTIDIKPDPKHPDPQKATPKATVVSLFWKDATGAHRSVYYAGYSLRLEFGALANGQLPGSIYLCTPDPEKSFLAGTFTAKIKPQRK